MKIVVFGDFDKKHNNFGVYDSATNKVSIVSYLDLFQDLKFDGVKYLNAYFDTKANRVLCSDRFIRIPDTLDKYRSSNMVFCLAKNSNTGRFLLLPSCEVVTTDLKSIRSYVYEKHAISVNFDFKRLNNRLYMTALTSENIGTL